ncbi:hypothetical protein DSO57_1037928 [Entomophthora muscae]|uniref:Uncharacterized protein n=1 Tax=Entomophthora muscae TaxID=34485 RepID=A0ACC2RPS6_9FUNG|nr:hypothetical protein DSO57_1037928 [Entomophthora muscae]
MGFFSSGGHEVWFYIYQEKTLHTLEERELGYWDSGKRAKAIEKLLEHLGDPADSAMQLLSNWNKRKVKSQPCMAHFVKVLVWMLFDKPVEALTIEEARESQRILQMFKVKLAIPVSTRASALLHQAAFALPLSLSSMSASPSCSTW